MLPPVSGGTVSQRWGFTGLSSNGPYYDNRFNPAKYYPSGFHTGVDIVGPVGQKIRNLEHGIVVAASWNGCEPNGSCWGYGGGYVVIVRHNRTPVFTSHAHMRKAYVRPGQPVHRGQPLGELDTMGYATGPHDHCSLWIRGLWYTANRGYTLDPWASFYGDLRHSPLLAPARCHVARTVNLRAGPGLGYPKVCENRTRTVLPMFKLRQGGAVPGYQLRTWRLVWCGRWAWVFAPLSDVVRTADVTDDALEAMGAIPMTDTGEGTPRAGTDQERTEHAPSADESLYLPEPEPVGSFESESIAAMYADDEDAF